MWIIVSAIHGGYLTNSDGNNTSWSSDRDEAKRFTKQEAKDFMAKHSITGSIIPA